jgi:hypothetical protein
MTATVADTDRLARALQLLGRQRDKCVDGGGAWQTWNWIHGVLLSHEDELRDAARWRFCNEHEVRFAQSHNSNAVQCYLPGEVIAQEFADVSDDSAFFCTAPTYQGALDQLMAKVAKMREVAP